MIVQIDRPIEDELVNVVQPGTDPGYICAQGTVDEFQSKGDPTPLSALPQVYALIYPGHLEAVDLPAVHPANAQLVNVSAGGNWYTLQLPGAICSNAPNYPEMTLVVWAALPGVDLEARDFHHIFGLCSDHVDCGLDPTPGPGEPPCDPSP
jgi:hypothetical protein